MFSSGLYKILEGVLPVSALAVSGTKGTLQIKVKEQKGFRCFQALRANYKGHTCRCVILLTFADKYRNDSGLFLGTPGVKQSEVDQDTGQGAFTR